MAVKLPRFPEDVLAQPASLAQVLERQVGGGRPALVQAASLLRGSKRILITGIGASLYSSVPLENFLCSHGMDAISIEAAELLHYRQDAYRDAAVVMISRSGESIEITKLITALKGRLPIVGVSNESDSTLAHEADVDLQIGSFRDEMVAIQTYTGTLLTLYLLGHAVLGKLGEAQEDVERLLPMLSQLIASNFERILQWDAIFDGDMPIHFLGRGPSYGSAQEGALLFAETAKAAAVSMPTASFRHGPVELVDNNFRGIIFAPQARTRTLNLALARELIRFGGRVRLIGPPLEDASGFDWCDTPLVSEMIAPLPDIIPVQVAALRLAQLKGIPAGSFRYVPQVTKDEASFRQQ